VDVLVFDLFIEAASVCLVNLTPIYNIKMAVMYLVHLYGTKVKAKSYLAPFYVSVKLQD